MEVLHDWWRLEQKRTLLSFCHIKTPIQCRNHIRTVQRKKGHQDNWLKFEEPILLHPRSPSREHVTKPIRINGILYKLLHLQKKDELLCDEQNELHVIHEIKQKKHIIWFIYYLSENWLLCLVDTRMQRGQLLNIDSQNIQVGKHAKYCL